MSTVGWHWAYQIDTNYPCCDDWANVVCIACRGAIRVRLHTLAKNIAIGAALCAAFDTGETFIVRRDSFDEITWRPGCGAEFCHRQLGFRRERNDDMSVYVDKSIHGYGRMVMCHMIADTADELHTMAERIGIHRSWFQQPPSVSFWHYDISKSKRALAVAAGAIECERNEFVEAMRRIRQAETFGPNPMRQIGGAT